MLNKLTFKPQAIVVKGLSPEIITQLYKPFVRLFITSKASDFKGFTNPKIPI